MALKATIFKASLDVANMDRGHYANRELTLARHPSETDARMMVRLLAWCLNDSDSLEFTRGLSSTEEGDLCERDATGGLTHWIELGEPDEKRIKQASRQSEQVTIYCYQSRSAAVWWRSIGDSLERYKSLAVVQIPDAAVAEMAALVERNMHLQCSIQEGDIWLSCDAGSVHIEPLILKARESG
ncbi:MAG: YaeQ family protein [Pseudomonadota bacterium]